MMKNGCHWDYNNDDLLMLNDRLFNAALRQSDDVISWLCQIYKKSLVFNLTCKTLPQIYTPINIYVLIWYKIL